MRLRLCAASFASISMQDRPCPTELPEDYHRGMGREARSRGGRCGLAALVATVGVVLAVTLVTSSGAAVASQASTTASIKPSFSPDRLGAPTSATFSVHFSGGPEGIPPPLHKAVIQLPAGLELKSPATPGCTAAHLQAHGRKGCPANSLVGRGHALLEIKLGAVPESEQANVTAFVGPRQNGEPTLNVLEELITPLESRVVFTMKVLPDQAPYGSKLEGIIPPIPTIPLEPDSSPEAFSLTLGKAGHGKSGSILVPHHCPAGGFPWGAEFTYADGSVSESTANSPCP